MGNDCEKTADGFHVWEADRDTMGLKTAYGFVHCLLCGTPGWRAPVPLETPAQVEAFLDSPA